jgi:hypothetical protein
LAEKLSRKIEIDAARSSRDRSADRARYANANVSGMQYTKGRFA